jgi:DNA (cytosine-5)-methyltransferase 1
MLLGHTCVCAVEIEPYCRKVLLQRQRDGILPMFPIWDDVRTFDGKPWRGKVDVLCGGFPCQDISVGNQNAEGIYGARSGLWREMARIIREVRPRFALVENSPALVIRGLGRVLGDLAEMGMDARWGVLGVGDAGGLHQRNRIWIFASAHNQQERVQRFKPKAISKQPGFSWCKNVRRLEDLRRRSDIPSPQLCRSHNGVASYVDRISAIGNGQVPAVVKLAWETLSVSL